MTDETPETPPEDAPTSETGGSAEGSAAAGAEETRPVSAADATPADAESNADAATEAPAADETDALAAGDAPGPEAETEAPAEKPKRARRPRRKAAEPAAEAEEPAEIEAAGLAETEAEEPADIEAEAVEPGAETDEPEKPPKPSRRAKPTAPAKPATSRRRRARRDPDLPPPVVRAQAKYVRSSARKARLVCDHIRGKSVDEARAILAFTPRSIASDWIKLLESAVANAEHNHELVGEDLYVKAVHADEGPTIKRYRPRARGRATPIHKRTSHLTILLTPKD